MSPALQASRSIAQPAPELAPEGALALDVEHLTHSYGSRKALDDVSIRIGTSTFTVLLGLNGAGKSTLFALITRLFNAQRGSIRIFGQELRRKPGEALKQLGVVFQARTLDLDLSVWQNLLYHAALHGMTGSAARQRAERVLAQVALERTRAREGTQPLGRSDAPGGDRTRSAAPPQAAPARRADGGTLISRPGQISFTTSEFSSKRRGSASCGLRI